MSNAPLSQDELNELHRLIDELENETISAQLHGRLQSILRESPDAMQWYFRRLDTDDHLRRLLGGTSVMDGMNLPVEIHSSNQPTTDRDSGVRIKNRVGGLLVAALACAATLFFALWMTELGRNESIAGQQPLAKPAVNPVPPDVSSARLRNASEAVFFGQLTPPINSALRIKADYVLNSGIVELEFASGATALIDAPAVFQIVSDDCLAIDVGRCSVHAPEGAEGFRVETPTSRIVDLGTRFVVNVDESSDSQVTVVEGEAEVFGKRVLQDSRVEFADGILLTDDESHRFSFQNAPNEERSPVTDHAYRRQLPDRIVGYNALASGPNLARELVSVSVQRDGELRTYSTAEMIGCKLVSFRAGQSDIHGSNLNVLLDGTHSDPSGLKIRDGLADWLLTTGQINPGGSVQPLRSSPVINESDESNTPGMSIEFLRPVVNGPGPDVLVMEIQMKTNPATGDPFHVTPVPMNESGITHTVKRYDLDLASSESIKVDALSLIGIAPRPLSLEQLTSSSVESARPLPSQFHAIAVGIDLSSLGVPPGGTVEGLFLQDAHDDRNLIDPVVIAGFPPQ